MDNHALRSVHAKSHALLEGQLTVLPNLPPELAQGLFEVPGSYPVVVRLSSSPGDLLDDSVSTPRGLAIKVVGVHGPRLAGSQERTTQDFVMINGPAFAAPSLRKFLGSLKLLASTTDKAPHLKSALSAALRGAEKLLESVGGHSGTLRALGGEPATHPLGETYFTQVPIRFGEYIAKLSLEPCCTHLIGLKGVAVPITESPNALREALQDFFNEEEGVWQLRAQLCRDLKKMRWKTPQWYGPRTSVRIDPSHDWSCRGRPPGARRVRGRSMRGCHSTRGMDSKRIDRSGRSCAHGKSATKPRSSSALSTTQRRSANPPVRR